MPEAQSPLEIRGSRRQLWPERKRWRFTIGIGLLLFAAIMYAWLTREQIARDIISDELERLGIPATYQISSIGPGEQVLTDLVVGDPARPDFTADRVTVELFYGLGPPEIGRVALVNPRLYGSYHGGKLSFGTLDAALFAPSEEPPALPSIDLILSDGRALIESDYGPVGIKAEGSGNLADGFVGLLAMSAPGLSGEGCLAQKMSVFGRVETAAGLPSFNGPVRLREMLCKDVDVALKSLDWQVDASASKDFSAFELGGALRAQTLRGGGFDIEAVEGTPRFSWNAEGLRARYEVAAQSVVNEAVTIASLNLDGGFRASPDFAQLDADVKLEGGGVGAGSSLKAQIAGLNQPSDAAVFAPLLERLGSGLERASDGNRIQADLGFKQRDGARSLVIPQALLRDRDGQSLASLSRVQLQFGDAASVPKIDGNAIINGRDLPQLRARMEQSEGNRRVMRIAMEPYTATGSSLALPDFTLVQAEDGSVTFSGTALASGSLAEDGKVDALALPISGGWAPSSGFALFDECSRIRVRSVTYSGMVLQQPTLDVCPRKGAGLRFVDGNLAVDLVAKPAKLAGRLADQRLRISTGAISYSSARGLDGRDMALELGEGEDTSRFGLTSVTGKVDDEFAGQFSGATFALAAVPLDIEQGAGNWRIEDGVLTVNQASLTVSDREEDPRFEPLITRDAVLTFADGVILAEGIAREPYSDRKVSRVSLRHDLSSGAGNARLYVEDLFFDEALQPAAGSDVCLNRDRITPGFRPQTPGLSCLALGIVANVEGTVSGEGRIDWTADDITSSGTFTTKDANLAAAFGPVQGVSGTVVFTDLLDLTTAPNQTFTIRSINPGVEVFDGEVAFNLREGQVLEIERGSWPFMAGELALQPTVLDFRKPMDRRYTLVINGLDAAKFIQYMELGNLSATGVFDGSVPIVFDTDGNGRIEQGLLTSRPPGGNLSYIGELTYEDLGAMANFAFQSLRSLDFTQMEVEMNGPLTGEIITRLRFDGVSQGEGASSNIVTRRIAKLPIQFRINIRADFYSLLTNLQSMYDPAFVRDPRELGLLSSDGKRFVVPEKPAPPAQIIPDLPAIKPDEPGNSDISDEPAIQGQESETMP